MTQEKKDAKPQAKKPASSDDDRKSGGWQHVTAGGLGVFGLAILAVIYLINSGNVCFIEEVSTEGVKGVKVCDVAAQVGELIEDEEKTKIDAVVAVLVENDEVAKSTLKTLLQEREAEYLAALTDANLSPTHLEKSLKKASFYSTKSNELSTDYEVLVQDFIKSGEQQNETADQPIRLLSSDGYKQARNAVSDETLLDNLRSKASKKEGPFAPLGVEMLASLPREQRPGKCQVYVKDALLDGFWLRIEGQTDGVIFRQAVQALPEEINGRPVLVDLQVNSKDADALRLLRLSQRRSRVFVREATDADLRQGNLQCDTPESVVADE